MPPDSRLIPLFLDMIASERGAARNTLLAYGRDLQGASDILCGRLGGAADQDIRRLFAAWSDLSPASLRRKRSALRRFFTFLQMDSIRPDNPTADIDAPRAARRLPRSAAVSEVIALLDVAAARASGGDPRAVRDSALMELVYGSGLRATELVSLPRNAIRPPQPFAIVVGKGGRERMVPVSDAALKAVSMHLAQVPPESRYLFPSGKSFLSRVRLFQIVRELGLEAGIDPARLSPHVLRHAFATHMLEGGADLRSLQMLLGHADISTTEIYTHVSFEQLQRTVEKLHPLSE